MWLPGVVLIFSLTAWHFVARRPWRFRAHVPLFMAAESVLLAPPLYAIGILLLAQAGDLSSNRELLERSVLAVGAGVYEEMVFRLMLLTGLLLLLKDACRLPGAIATAAALAGSSVLFALCHYHPVGSELFELRSFLMRSLAGVYLGAIYVYRGLGIATGTHVAYNLSLVLLWR
jgi:membrane protease YdiL (CAAX protease family)